MSVHNVYSIHFQFTTVIYDNNAFVINFGHKAYGIVSCRLIFGSELGIMSI